jgi:hypothetical protein
MEDYLLYIGFSLLGLMLHWLKRYVKKETANSFKQYLLVEKKYTIISLATVISSSSALVETGAVDVSSPQSLAQALILGYTLDSVLNKE